MARRRSFPLFRSLAAVLGLALTALAGCSRDSSRDEQASRVVGVSKQINEFMYDIGAQGVMVARDLTSVYPEQIKELPSVGYHRALSAEGIISMKPTLLLTDGNMGPDAVIEQVRKVGVPVLVLKPGTSVDSAQSLMLELGKRFGRQQAAASVVAKWKQDMQQIWQDTAQWTGKPHPRVLIMHFGQIVNNYLAVGRGGTADKVLHWAGGENAADSISGMGRLTPEMIAKIAPDVILATDVGFDRAGTAEKFALLPGVALTPAAKAGRIYRVDEHEIMYFTPGTPASVRRIAELIHR